MNHFSYNIFLQLWLHCVWHRAEQASWVIDTDLVSDFKRSSDDLKIYALAVGQGDSTILICPENNDLFIFDMGSVMHVMEPEYIQNVLLEYGKKYISARINIVISHGDLDHYNYLYEVFNSDEINRRVDRIILGGSLENYIEKFNSWISKFDKVSIINDGKSCFGNSQCTVKFNSARAIKFPSFCGSGSHVKFEALAANLDSNKGNKNARSIILRIDYKEWSILLPGDFETSRAENQLIEKYMNSGRLHVNMYKISHHGASKYANSQKFLDVIRPDAAFASQVPPPCKNHHPRCDTIYHLLRASQMNTLAHPLHYSLSCYHNPDIHCCSDLRQKDIHVTCPGGATHCSTLKLVSNGRGASVWYIPYYDKKPKCDGARCLDRVCTIESIFLSLF